MTDTSKDKIRVERYEEFKNEYILSSNKLLLVELKNLIDNEFYRVIQEILYQTGEDHIYFESGNLTISAIKVISGSYEFKTNFNIYYSELESNKEYESRLNQLKVEEAQLKELATKFGYKLEKQASE